MNIFQRIWRGVTNAKSYTIQELAKKLGAMPTFSDSKLMDQYSKSVYVYACVDKIAKYTATIQLSLHEITNSKGDTKEVLVSPVLDLLYKPNPVQTRSVFFRTTFINKKLTGKAYIYKVRNNNGDVVELWNLRPDLVSPNKDADGMVVTYNIAMQNGASQVVPAEDVIFLQDPDPLDMFDGMSAIQPARSRIATEQSATDFQKNFFDNNGRPDAFLRTEETLDQEQVDEIQTKWQKRHAGKGNNSKIGILQGGMEYQQISLSQREMDYIESLKFTRDDILVAFGVPKSVVTTDDVNRANAEAGIAMFIAQTIKPEMIQLVETLNEFLIVPDFDETLYLDFKDPTPEDRTQRLAEFTQGVDKWITRNEIRNELGLPDIEGGNDLYGSIANIPLGTVIEQPQDDTEKIFRGRRFLQLRLSFLEQAKDVLKKTVKKGLKKKKSGKKKLKSFYNAERKKIYGDVVIKLIDKKAQRFKKALGNQMERQEERVLKELEAAAVLDEKSLKEKIAQSALNSILNKKKEDKLVATFALPFLTEFLKSSGQDALNLIGDGGEFNLTPAIQKSLEKRSKFFANSINDTTFSKLATSLTAGIEAGEGVRQLSDRVRTVYDQYSEYRLELIARTESTYANNDGFEEAYKQSDIVKGKEWVATIDDRTREEHLDLDGEIVELGENFSNGLPYPQEFNCRCVIAPAIEE